MLNPKNDAELVATDDDLSLFMYAGVEQTGPLHALPQDIAEELGVDWAVEGFNSVVLEIRKNGKPVKSWNVPDCGWSQHNFIRKKADWLLRKFRKRLGI